MYAIFFFFILAFTACTGVLCAQGTSGPVSVQGRPAPASPAVEDLDWPGIELTLGALRVMIAVPDAERGFYRGARFDHAGFIYRAELGSLRLFGPWTAGFKRGNSDSVTGTAGEFGMSSPLGFQEAGPGDTFVKIGVGTLKRGDASPYFFSKTYELVNRGSWSVSHGEAFYEAKQVLEPVRGWAYDYTKRIELIDASTIRTTYLLKNSGSKDIDTDYYAHNFFVFNGENLGEGDGMEVLADLAGVKLPRPATMRPRVIEFSGPIVPSKGYFVDMPLPMLAKGSAIARVYNKKSGASIRIECDYSPYKLVFYGHSRALCAEPFIKISLKPGEELSWSDTYFIDPGVK